jgi:hypothetical protein
MHIPPIQDHNDVMMVMSVQQPKQRNQPVRVDIMRREVKVE